MTTTPATTVNPVEIDTQLSALSTAYGQADSRHETACETAREIAGERKVRRGRSRVYESTNKEAVVRLRVALNQGQISSHEVHSAERLLERIDTYRAEMRRIAAEIHPLNIIYVEHRWTRWYLIDGGHLHRDLSSSRCSRTRNSWHYWMVELSGQPVDQVIEQAGDRVCTVCFAAAPVVRRPATGRFMTLTEAERAAHAEDLARRQAAKKAAQITTPDGQELRTADGVHGDLIKTEVAAQRRAVQEAADLALYGTSGPDATDAAETVIRMVRALAHRRGRTPVQVFSEIVEKVSRKADREGWGVRAGWSQHLYAALS